MATRWQSGVAVPSAGAFCIQSAWMFGAGRVIAMDRVPERLEMARKHGRAETINFEKSDATVYKQNSRR